jgi:hypothetical protein
LQKNIAPNFSNGAFAKKYWPKFFKRSFCKKILAQIFQTELLQKNIGPNFPNGAFAKKYWPKFFKRSFCKKILAQFFDRAFAKKYCSSFLIGRLQKNIGDSRNRFVPEETLFFS